MIGNNVVTVPTDSEFLLGLSNGDADATVQLFDGETELEAMEDKIGSYTVFQFETSGVPSRKHYKGVFTKTETEGEDEEAVTTVIYNVTVDILVICQKMSVAYRDLTGGSGGSYVLPEASANTLGGIKVGANLTINEGVLSTHAPYELPTASNQTLGGVKVGNGLSMDANGTLSTVGLVTSITSEGTDSQYPSAKATYDNLVLKEDASNKVTTVSSESTDSQYPSARATYAGLALKENVANKVTSLSASSTNSEYPSAKATYDNLVLKEDASNKVTSMTASSTDAQYPSAKATYDNLVLKENLSNKVTSLSASSTDIQYPTAKCVYDLIGDVETLINAI